jgi:hypothetical protein
MHLCNTRARHIAVCRKKSLVSAPAAYFQSWHQMRLPTQSYHLPTHPSPSTYYRHVHRTLFFLVPPRLVAIEGPSSGEVGDTLSYRCLAKNANPIPEIRWVVNGKQARKRRLSIEITCHCASSSLSILASNATLFD